MSLKEIELKYNVDLRKYTSIKIGGKAQHFFLTSTRDDLHRVIKDIGPSFYVLGKGSNLLIQDRLIKKPIIKLGHDFNYIKKNGNFIEIGASTPLPFLIKYCIANNLAGLENLVGIPATMGGLIFSNASAYGSSISSCIKEVDLLDREGNFKTLKKNAITFDYRFSSLKDYIILGAKFSLSPDVNLKQKASNLLKKRLRSQDFNFPSCGCIFKNPANSESAGFLIESCGLKKQRKGDAQVSGRHANFIINLGRARYSDVDYLIEKIKDRVYKKYNITLEEEIKRWS